HRNQAAIQTLKVYLDGEQASSVAAQVRKLIAQLEGKESLETGAASNIDISDAEHNRSEASTDNAGMPPDVDAQKPSLAAGVPCPANILELAANSSKALVDNVEQFSAI